MDAGWQTALAPVGGQIDAMWQFLSTENYLPERDRVLRAFDDPFDDVRVLMVGQDPYPRREYPIGLAFAVERHVRPLPGSLRNIYRELHDDLGIEPAAHGDLSAWSRQGVLLLNRVLTVREGQADSHRGAGWEQVTDAAISALVARRAPLVAILWGRKAETVRPVLGDTPVIVSSHPSPLAVARGDFFGSRPFSRANALLESQGADPVNWALE